MRTTEKAETPVKYEEYVGFKFFRIHDFMFQLLGAHIETLEVDRTENLKRYFGNFMMAAITMQGWSTTMASLKSFEDEVTYCTILQDLKNVYTKLLLWLLLLLLRKQLFASPSLYMSDSWLKI